MRYMGAVSVCTGAIALEYLLTLQWGSQREDQAVENPVEVSLPCLHELFAGR